MSRFRLDQRLVELKLAPTRSKAQQLIQAGEVQVNGKVVTQTSFAVSPETKIEVLADAQTLKYVSRGGLKLEAALKHFQINVTGMRCLDVGLSTGGFTDCLLQHGAAHVAGIDVGHDQLHVKLREDPRLIAWSGVHVKDLAAHAGVQDFVCGGLDLIVVDVSFISLVQVLPHLPPSSHQLLLVKPQFELSAEQLNKKGIVKDAAAGLKVVEQIATLMRIAGIEVRPAWTSAVQGQDGNQEYFLYATASRSI